MKLKKVMAITVAGAMTVSMAACGSNNGGSEKKGADTSDQKSFADIELGKDYTDLKADLKFLTHRTDVVDTEFQEYIKEFQKDYPNINITYEAIADYANDVTTRLSTGDWGDICMIPTTIDKNELPNYFVSYGTNEELSEKYIMLNNFTYDKQVYGIPSMGNCQGVVYNKKVFEQAGVTELPKTPDEFLDALKKIKEKTDAIPLYTNFAAGWTMTAWDAYIGGSATGDPDYTNNKLVHGKDPFAKQSDMTGPYAVYYTLYQAVAQKLTEDDPTTTDWEGSKGMINSGKIGCMVLGSWAIIQMQQGGDNPDDIGYMTFPITVNGKQYSTAGPDYNYGINVNSSADQQLAAKIYVKWLTEKSNYAVSCGAIPISKDAEWPKAYDSLKEANVEFVIDNPAPEGEETLYNDINNESELGLNSNPDKNCKLVEAALDGSQTLDEIMDEWNEKWTAAQESNGALE